MSKWLVFDTNLLLLLVVGRASPSFVTAHKRLSNNYTTDDYWRVEELLDGYAGVVVIPQVLAEVSNLARQISGPARRAVQLAFRALIESVDEVWLPSEDVIAEPEFVLLGLTDVILLRLCTPGATQRECLLLTADQPLAFRAESLGCNVVNYYEL